MKNKKVIITIALFIVVFIVVYFFALDNLFNGGKGGDKNDSKNSVALISQVGNNLKLNLGFNNDKNEKSIVNYVLLLHKADEDGKIIGDAVADVKKYPESVVLGGKSLGYINKEVSYDAPSYLNGKYSLVINYLNEAGNQTDSFIINDINFNNSESNDLLEILAETCILQVEGEDPNIRYASGRGVDVRENENLIVTCSIKNNSEENISASLNFKNYRISHEFGNIVEQEKAPSVFMKFNAGETKTVSTQIVKASEPQAYDAGLYFANNFDKQISNMAYFHYVVVGESARIFNVTLDSDYYTANSTVEAKISYGGSADRSEYSRTGGTKNETLVAEIDIRDVNDQSCLAEKNSTNLNVEKFIETKISLNTIKECQNPFIVAILKGKDGKILDNRVFLREVK